MMKDLTVVYSTDTLEVKNLVLGLAHLLATFNEIDKDPEEDNILLYKIDDLDRYINKVYRKAD